MTVPNAVPAIDPRTLHYGAFYGLDEPAADGPVALVLGNCQAESLRVMLDAGDLRTVRAPAVHELTSDDVPHLDRWLARTDLLVVQPIRDDYHALPLGSRQLASRLPSTARVVRIPVLRFAGLFPTHAIVRPPSDPGMSPPIAPYHDLRLLARAAGSELPPLTARRVRDVGAASIRELTRREDAHDTLVLSDLFARPDFSLMRTLNHPGNPVWSAAASRVRARAGLPEAAVDPGRPLLDSIHAPREAAVFEAWNLDGEPIEHWRIDGRLVPADEIAAAHLDWYAEHPEVVTAGLQRHADTLRLLAA